MAGAKRKHNKRTAVEREYERRAIDGGFDSALEYVLAYLAGGGTWAQLARSIGTAQGFEGDDEVGRNTVRDVAEKLAEDAPARLAAARVHGGNAMAEQTLDIADAATEADVRVAELRIKQRQYLAGTLNPALRPNQGASISISFGGMHIDALRQRQITATATLTPHDSVKQIPSQVVDAEEVSISEGV